MEFLQAQEDAALRKGAAHDDVEAQILLDALESMGDARVAAWRGDLAAFRKEYLAPAPQPAPVAPPATTRFRWRYAAAAAAVLAIGTTLFPRGGGKKEERADGMAETVPVAATPLRLAAVQRDAPVGPEEIADDPGVIRQHVITVSGAAAQYLDSTPYVPDPPADQPASLRQHLAPASGTAARYRDHRDLGINGGAANDDSSITQVAGSGQANQELDSGGY